MNTDPTSTDPTSTGSPVTIAEIAEFLRHLRALSRPSTCDNDPTGQPAVERAAFLARKAELFARIAAAHPDLIPTATSPTATSPTATSPTATSPTATSPTATSPTVKGTP
jgi:hypothetical protein